MLSSAVIKISPICKLCGEEEGDSEHFLLECKTLDEKRKTQKWAAYANHLGLHLV